MEGCGACEHIRQLWIHPSYFLIKHEKLATPHLKWHPSPWCCPWRVLGVPESMTLPWRILCGGRTLASPTRLQAVQCGRCWLPPRGRRSHLWERVGLTASSNEVPSRWQLQPMSYRADDSTRQWATEQMTAPNREYIIYLRETIFVVVEILSNKNK